jgi:hypothetical protein
MFRAAHLSSSGALNCIWFIYCNKVKDFIYILYIVHIPDSLMILTIHFNQSKLYRNYYCNILICTIYNIYEIFYLIAVYKPEAANTVWSSWWWAVCHSKHVELSINFGIINSITRLHLVGYFYWFVFKETWIFRTEFRENFKNEILLKIHLAGTELFLANRRDEADGKFVQFVFNVPKNV